MIVIDEFLNIKLVKRNGGWRLQTSDSMWHLLNKHKNEFKTDCVIIQFFIDNLEKTIGLQGTSIQSLRVTREQVADWIVKGEI